ncbi:MAG: hypothetical protein A2172_01985 [Candidatus Woykebacteria bacterium RBG_13_40_15]|uniref:Phosphatidylglycerol--prolipoprotein diacylglyceryl transferase n=1 Tax=Candidatus Woykebacteria bacterium RBG_13_40_15 TaxID=1802593 RepID=A0A1G1W644_9BACT|nr:MAG: hypothetical protein A2172_01985 [Candidatus Woykebacteria bacterium RBG_13_40_15]
MFPVLFKIGSTTIYSWGFFLGLAYLAGTFIFWREGKRQGYNEEKLFDFSIFALIAALVGGRALFVILNWDLFRDDQILAFYFWQGGYAYYGALLLVFLISLYLVRVWRWSFFQIADIASLSGLAALSIGSIGAFLAGLNFGKLSSLPWAVTFPSLLGARHPVQLYEATSYFLLFLILYILYFKNLAGTNMKSGKVFFSFLILSSLVQVITAYFHAQITYLGPVPLNSAISGAIAILSIVALYYLQIRDIRNDVRVFLKTLFVLNWRILRRLKF